MKNFGISEVENMANGKYWETEKPVRSRVAGRSYKEMLQTVEARSKRMQCLVQPSVYGKVEAKAKQQGVSVNEFVHSLLEAATAELQEVEYDEISFDQLNDETLEAFREIDEGGGIKCSSAEDLFAKLGI